MDTYEKKIDQIRLHFSESKAERYPIENSSLKSQDEYIKSLYIRMLCTLVRYTGEPSEGQSLYIKRLIAGIHTEKEFLDYLRMALEINTNDVDSFVDAFKSGYLKFYFCIDGIILLSMEESNDKNYEFLAELIELLSVTKEELKHISVLAKAIIEQNSDAIENADMYATDTTKTLSIYHYIKGFYSGLVSDTDKEICIYSYNKEEYDLADYGIYETQKVLIDNVTTVITDNIYMKNCKEVIIRNCNFICEGKGNFIFTNISKITFENCKFRDFKNRVAQFIDTQNLIVYNNQFNNCGYTTTVDAEGGVFSNIAGAPLESVVLEKNELNGCYIA